MTTANVPHRKLGIHGPEVPALGFGLMGMSVAYGTPPSDEERFKVLDRAHELGATFWDSSDLYGDSEELLGKWFRRTGRRNDIFLATKFGFVKGSTFVNRHIDSSASYCKKACAASLKALGTDTIDLYYAHRVNPDTPIEETMRAMAELKAEGKIRHIGLSEVSSATVRRAYKIAPVDAVQTEYSPFELSIEGPIGTDLLATCRELGITLVAYAPLGRGMLTGTFGTPGSVTSEGDLRSTNFPRFSPENIEANAKLVQKFKALADKKSCTSSQLALAWLLKQGDDIIPIPGTKKIKYLEENWGALDIHLTNDEVSAIRELVNPAYIAGGRYSDQAITEGLADTREEV